MLFEWPSCTTNSYQHHFLPIIIPLADRVRLIEVRDMLVEAQAAVVELLDQGQSLEEILEAEPLAELDPRWAQGLVKGRLFTRMIYQSETGDWEVPEK